MKPITLGYETPSANKLERQLKHAVVTGVTEGGKTTAIEGFIRQEINNGRTGLVFLTKKGEEEFTNGNKVKPFFKDNPGQHQDLVAYVQELLEALTGKSLNRAEAELINVVDARSHDQIEEAETLEDVHDNLNTLLKLDQETDSPVSLHGKVRSEFLKLEKYFDRVMGQFNEADLAETLHLQQGKLNIMDLRGFNRELQSLIIERTLQKIYREHKDIRVAIPEAWKFAPQQGSNICKDAIVQIVREGATNDNYLIIDAQDITQVAKEPLKQMRQWVLGLQMEKNEVERTRDQMPVPKKKAPSKKEIMNLSPGHFFYCEASRGNEDIEVKKFYARPAWMNEINFEGLTGDELAKAIATEKVDIHDLVSAIENGEIDIGTQKIEDEQIQEIEEEEQEEIDYREKYRKMQNRVENLQEKIEVFKREIEEQEQELEEKNEKIEELEEKDEQSSNPGQGVKDVIMGADTQDEDNEKIEEELEEKLDELSASIHSREEIVEIAESVIDNKNIPTKEDLQAEIQKADIQGKQKDYAEDIQSQILQEYQEDAVQKIMKDVDNMTERQKQLLLYLEARGKGVGSKSKWYRNGLNASGNYGTAVKEYMDELIDQDFVRKDKAGNLYPNTQEKVESKLENYEASQEEIKETYNKVLAKIKTDE
jgi:hypothetical protein